MNKPEPKISADGLRHENKASGSYFGYSPYASSTLSCYKCGGHKLKSSGSFKRLLGQTMFICGDCKPTKSTISKSDKTL